MHSSHTKHWLTNPEFRATQGSKLTGNGRNKLRNKATTMKAAELEPCVEELLKCLE